MSEPFKPKVFAKEGCPYSFKVLVFLAEAGVLDRVEVVRLDPAGPAFEATKRRLAEGLGKAATFPTAELEPGRFLADSERIIAHFAERHGVDPARLPVLAFYKDTIYPQVVELHAREEAAHRHA